MQLSSYLRILCVLCGASSLFAEPGISLSLKKDFASGKKNLCLTEIVDSENMPARDADKLARYCQVELKAPQTKFTAKDIELYAWAAGVIPEKILGAQVVVTKSDRVEAETRLTSEPARKVRRGTPVRLILRSANMKIEREAVILMDSFTGETVEVRLSGTRRNLRAHLSGPDTAELIGP